MEPTTALVPFPAAAHALLALPTSLATPVRIAPRAADATRAAAVRPAFEDSFRAWLAGESLCDELTAVMVEARVGTEAEPGEAARQEGAEKGKADRGARVGRHGAAVVVHHVATDRVGERPVDGAVELAEFLETHAVIE